MIRLSCTHVLVLLALCKASRHVILTKFTQHPRNYVAFGLDRRQKIPFKTVIRMIVECMVAQSALTYVLRNTATNKLVGKGHTIDVLIALPTGFVVKVVFRLQSDGWWELVTLYPISTRSLAHAMKRLVTQSPERETCYGKQIGEAFVHPDHDHIAYSSNGANYKRMVQFLHAEACGFVNQTDSGLLAFDESKCSLELAAPNCFELASYRMDGEVAQ